MDKKAAKRKFFKYFSAAVFSALASCIYSLGDTIIIGQYEGDGGIKALNIILPVYILFYAIGLLFGMGAGIMISYCRGKGQRTDGYFSVSLCALVLLSIVLTIISELFFVPIMTFLGAQADTLPYLESYGRYVTRGAVIFTLMPYFNCVVRNDNGPMLVTAGVIIGCISNVLLDYILVFVCDMGMAGAGCATLVCSALQMLISATHMVTKKSSLAFTLKGLKARELFEIAGRGFASFVSEISGGVLMVILNRQLLLYVVAGVEIYAVVANIVLVTNSLLNGAAVAAQPIISDAFGAQKHDEVVFYKKIGLITVSVIAVVLYVIVAVYPQMYAYAFSSAPSKEFLQGVPSAVRMYMTSVLFYGFNLFFINYYQATLRSKLSAVFNFMRGLLFSAIFAFVLPLIVPAAIWLAVPLGEALALAIICVFMLKSKKKPTQKGQFA